jgi:uncharacterized membrane protein
VTIAFGLSGIVHLVHPTTFTRDVPTFLPAKTALVYVSGVAELVCAAGLIRRERWAGPAAALLLLAVWPANLQMAIAAQRGDDVWRQVELWVRFPLQVPLIWFALQSRAKDSVPPAEPSGDANG